MSPLYRTILLEVACFASALLQFGPDGFGQDTVGQDGIEWGRWMILGPLEATQSGSDIDLELAPEKELHRLRAGGPGPRLEVEWKGKGHQSIEWEADKGPSPLELENQASNVATDANQQLPQWDERVIDLALDRPDDLTNNAACFLYRSIDAKQELALPVLFGADDALKVWLNGEELRTQGGARALSTGEFSATLNLKRGRNHLLVKVINGNGSWAFQMLHRPEELTRAKSSLSKKVNLAIDRGIEYLLSRQFPDGSWSYQTYPFRNGQTALSLYALLKSGLAPSHPACTRAVQYLKARKPTRTYSAAATLMAFEAMHDPAILPEMEAVTELLLEWRGHGFAYPMGAVDLSNTQYGALGLRAAARAGVKIRNKVWIDLAEDTLSFQGADGGFSYYTSNNAAAVPTGSMTAAGLTVLGIVRDVLGEKGMSVKLRGEIESSMQAGLKWMARHWTVDVNPNADKAGQKRWHVYYLYGMERVGGFFGLKRIGGFDWYSDGARRLILSQGAEGNWATAYGESEPNTAFALLFLNRATAPVSGDRSHKKKDSWGQDDASQAVSLRAKGTGPVAVWISSFGDQALAEHTWPRRQGGGLRIRRVEYSVDDELVTTVTGDPTSPASVNRYPSRLQDLPGGTHTLIARITLAMPPPNSSDVVLESAPLEFSLSDTVDTETLTYGHDAAENLLRNSAKEVTATSVLRGEFDPKRALDGRMSTSWLSENSEAEQSLVIDFDRAVKADTLLLSQAFPEVDKPLHSGRIKKLLVIINGNEHKATEVKMITDVHHKTTVSFGRDLTIRSLELRVMERIPGENLAQSVGFAEIELLRRQKNRR